MNIRKIPRQSRRGKGETRSEPCKTALNWGKVV